MSGTLIFGLCALSFTLGIAFVHFSEWFADWWVRRHPNPKGWW